MAAANDGDISILRPGKQATQGTNLSLETPQAIPAQQVCWAKQPPLLVKSPGCLVSVRRRGPSRTTSFAGALLIAARNHIPRNPSNSERGPASQAFLIVETLALYRPLSRSRTRNLHYRVCGNIKFSISDPEILTTVTLLRPRERCVRQLLLFRTVLPTYLAPTVPTRYDVSIVVYPRRALLGPR